MRNSADKPNQPANDDGQDRAEPLGERFRRAVGPAMENNNRKEIQAGYLSDFFAQIAQALEQNAEKRLNLLVNKIEKLAPAETILSMMSTGNGPIISFPMEDFNTYFTDFSEAEIRELPGFLAMHAVAYRLDIAVHVSNLFGGEGVLSSGMRIPPTVTFNLMKSYEEGASDNASLYPDLTEHMKKIKIAYGQNNPLGAPPRKYSL